MSNQRRFGRTLPAPENFVSDALAADICTHGIDEQRRGFLRSSFAAASAALVSGGVLAATDHPTPDGDMAILQPLRRPKPPPIPWLTRKPNWST
jgi:sulfane dehydrogenase subunit SoxC